MDMKIILVILLEIKVSLDSIQYWSGLRRFFFTEYVLHKIEEPIYYGSVDAHFGSWMVDSHPITDKDIHKFWCSSDNSYTLYEYAGKEKFLSNTPTK